MSSRYTAFLHAAPAALAAILIGCSTSGGGGATASNYHKDAAHAELLQSLRQCLVEIPISGERNKDFISPCVGRDVSALNGIPRHRLIDALGPARLCISQTDVNFPTKDDCPMDQNPVWSFYRHADSIDVGGGPELVCVANNQAKCATLEWRRTK